ncbi:unnamed protein product [Urochloa humidicola]
MRRGSCTGRRALPAATALRARPAPGASASLIFNLCSSLMLPKVNLSPLSSSRWTPSSLPGTRSTSSSLIKMQIDLSISLWMLDFLHLKMQVYSMLVR